MEYLELFNDTKGWGFGTFLFLIQENGIRQGKHMGRGKASAQYFLLSKFWLELLLAYFK